MFSRSPRFSMDAVDWRKTLRDMLFVAAAALLSWVSTEILPWLESLESEAVELIAIPVVAAAVAGSWRFIRSNQETKQ